MFFLMLYLTQEIKMDIETAGRLFSIYGFGAMAGAFLGGWLSDKFGTKLIQISSLLISGLGYIVLSYIKAPFMIGLMLFIIAVVAEAFRPASTAAMANVCTPETRLRGFALNRLALNLGIAIGPAIGGFLAVYDYSLIFWVEGFSSITAAIFLIVLFRDSQMGKKPTSAFSNPLVMSPLKDVIYIQFLIILIAIGITFNQIFNTWPIYLKEFYVLNEDHIGLLIAINALIIVLFEMPLMHRLEQKNILHTIAAGSFLLCFGFGAIMFSNSVSYAVFTVVIWTIGEMLTFPLVVTFIANRAPDTRRGAYMGLMTFTFSVSSVIGPVYGSWIYKNLGPNTLWLSLIILGLLTIPGYLFIDHSSKKLALKSAA